MHTIYKYTLNPNGPRIDMPKGAKILTAREQGNNICVWAEVNTGMSMESRLFEVFGTGHPMRYDMGVDRVYLGTAMLEGGTLVLHVYEYTGV